MRNIAIKVALLAALISASFEVEMYSSTMLGSVIVYTSCAVSLILYRVIAHGVSTKSESVRLYDYFETLKRELIFVVQFYPDNSRISSLDAALRSTDGNLRIRLRKLFTISAVKSIMAATTMLSLYIYFFPGLPDFMNAIEGPWVNVALRYVALSVLVSNVTLLIETYTIN